MVPYHCKNIGCYMRNVNTLKVFYVKPQSYQLLAAMLAVAFVFTVPKLRPFTFPIHSQEDEIHYLHFNL